MSRRKQSTPRHLDEGEGLTEGLPNDMNETTGLPEETSADLQDAHVCGHCRAEFLILDDFIEHKKVCMPDQMVVVCPENKDSADELTEKNDLINENGEESATEKEGQDADEDAAESRSRSPLNAMSPLPSASEAGLETSVRKIPEEGTKEYMEARRQVLLAAEEMESDEDYDDEMDDDGLDDGLDETGSQRSGLSYGESVLQNLMPNSNVKLESLESTRVAVAQFAENNNIVPADFAMLQTALITLHHQQLIQFHMLQQIQQHLMASTGGAGFVGKMPPMPPLPHLPTPSEMPIPPTLGGDQRKSNGHSSSSSSPTEANKENQTPNGPGKPLETTTNTSTPGLRADPPVPPTSLVVPSPQPFSSSINSGSSLFRKTPPAVPAASKPASTSLSRLDRSQYAADDPFFKHKCRFCLKVFGSDSALQIHIRSHTGERPYKCNVCGNRFSTKGNLKVHFQRHKEKYPHIRMNGEPVPEHLENGEAQNHVNMPPPLIPGPLGVPVPERMSQRSPGIPKLTEEKTDSQDFELRREDTQTPNNEKSSDVDDVSPAPTDASDNPLERSSVGSDMGCNVMRSTPFSTMSGIPTNSPISPLAAMSNMMASTPMPLPTGFQGMPPFASPFGMEPPPFLRGSILPPKNEDPMEAFMEIDKSSETRKLEQLVKNIESKLSDPNECAMCHRILSCKSALQMHYRTHTGERPFKCKICGRAFTTKGNLKTHMGVHRAKPPLRMMHQCPVCHKQFTNALVLQQHIRMHTNDIPNELKMQNEMMAAAAMGFMRPPFPGLPFPPPHGIPLPPGIPPMQTGELDLRKPPQMPSKEVKQERSESIDNQEERDHSHRVDERRESRHEEMNGRNEEDDHSKHQEDSKASEPMDTEENDIKDETETDYKPLQSHGMPKENGRYENQRENKQAKESEERANHSRPESQPSDPTSRYLNEYNNYFSQSQPASSSSGTPQYSTSLMALEERVKAIETMATAPSFHSQLYGNPYQQQPEATSPGEPRPLSRSSTPSGASVSSVSNDDQGTPGHKRTTPNPAVSPGSSGSMDGMENEGNALFPGGLEFQQRPFGSMGPGTTCNICYKTFACKSALEIHYRSHTKERPFRCDICDRGFSTRGNMKQHMLTHKIRDMPEDSFGSAQNGQALPASIPVKSESSPPSSVSPAASISSSISPPLSSMTTTPSTAVSPMASSMDSQSPFVKKPNLKHVCQVCQKPFSSASALQIHIRTHTGDKPFKCNVCGKAFTTKGNLKVHMGTHMWNNSPSRRGRRMSVDLAALAGQNKDAEYYRRYAHQVPDMYPYPPVHPFANGFSHKMNEIPVIQSLNGGMGRMPPVSMPEMLGSPFPIRTPEKKSPSISESKDASGRPKPGTSEAMPFPMPRTSPKDAMSYHLPPSYPPAEGYNNNNNDKLRTAANGELDLSMKKTSAPPSESPKPPQHPAWAWMQGQEASKPLMA